MKTITNLTISIAIAGLSLTAVAAVKVRAKYPFKSYIHPIGVLSVRETVGDRTTAYRWMGVYRADPNHPKIKAELQRVGKSEYYGVGDAAISVYAAQLRSAGIKIDGRMTGLVSYKIKDSRGRTWSVYARSDRDFHPVESGEFSVVIGIPGG
ncbi:hypothetical protein [Chamaesiphon polymorphus]|jgi:hypothetical protein|uniref:Uncharacterized protein n=1 Tax=Chamaesiphon polymorphus CCALA 037 TaxID=2107692 RepID=A0A2T1GNA3_9CYAN|nr:hypothetical protein [Chamaesiphon polymorphus]PSB59416.1 hypothetical protein C7B77_00915 [Chamaesiphon polymorphus CCALA 037]